MIHFYSPVELYIEKNGKVTPPTVMLQIKALEPYILRTVDLISPIIQTFLENPELPDWVPPSTSMNSSDFEFLKNLRIPAYSNGSPSLLYHDLHLCHDDDTVEKIFGRPNHVYVVRVFIFG